MKSGIPENRCLDFHSPYGCSKGAAEQYVHDYYRIYGLKTVVLRQSCIYGTRQFGVEDQGWISWFVIASLLKKPLTIYGDGKQVRDILWIDDLVDAYSKLFINSEKTAGNIFNVGGGPDNCISLHDLVKILKDEGILRETPRYDEWRPGDQKVYISDIKKIKKMVGWEPKVKPLEGIKKLIQWSIENKQILMGK
jgi:CDP-paratose 2-epimerase